MPKSSERPFEQIPTTPEELRDCKYIQLSARNIIAQLTPAVMTQFVQLGIVFQESWDNLDYFEGAIIRLPPGNEVMAVIRRYGHPLQVVEIHHDLLDKEHLAPFIKKTFKTFGIQRRQATWIRSPNEVVDLRSR